MAEKTVNVRILTKTHKKVKTAIKNKGQTVQGYVELAVVEKLERENQPKS